MPFRASAELTSEWRHFDFAIADRIATITFNRPEKLNALTFEVYADLRDILTELPHRDDVDVLVIGGQGRGFCSGGDVYEIIGELLKMDTRGLLEFTRMTGAVVQLMREIPVPIIASINGTAAGAGSVIALAADFRIMTTASSIALLFTRVGLAGADMGVAYLLPRLVGLSKATELLMLGDKITSEQADALNLVYRLVEAGELGAATQDLATRLSTGPRLAYGATKSLLTRELDMSLSAAVESEAVVQALLMTSRDHAEFFQSFSEKRPPAWTGR
jgi:enoyl-CoA hydratase/carnithine racemase